VSRLGGYNLAPEILFRWPRGMDILVPNRADHVAVRLWASARLEDMYGAPKKSGITGDPTQRRLVGQCRTGDVFFTSSLRERAQVITDRTTRHARFMVSIGDLDPPLLEDEVCYLAVQQVMLDGREVEVGPTGSTSPLLGFTLIAPPDSVYGMDAQNIHFQGIAPMGTGAKLGVPLSATTDFSGKNSPPPLLIALPHQCSGITLRTDVDGLGYSFDWGMPVVGVPAGSPLEITSSVKYLLLAALGAKVVPFAADTVSFLFNR